MDYTQAEKCCQNYFFPETFEVPEKGSFSDGISTENMLL